jgi:hypothetical protein
MPKMSPKCNGELDLACESGTLAYQNQTSLGKADMSLELRAPNPFFDGTMLSSIVDDRALSRPKLKASGTFLHLDNARSQLTSDKCDMLSDVSSTMTSH